MSKKECSKAYFNHKLAMEAARKVPKVSKVSKIFTRKPYSCTNYTVAKKASEENETRRKYGRKSDEQPGDDARHRKRQTKGQ